MPSPIPELRIQSSLSDYSVAFSPLIDLSQWCPSADLLLVDNFFRDRLTVPSSLPVIWVEANEEAKALEKILPIFVELKQAGLGRSSRITAIGGGVVQDIATFIASLFMRGISWSYVPTTFLGMADSCLGGKSSINVGAFKNLIGNFHPPSQIDILPVFARTLPAIEIAGGAAEAAKIAYCCGMQTFANYKQLAGPVLSGDWREEQLAELLHATLSVKKWFIETDEFDKAERRLLNFGHTWGHALESATSFAIPHGLAVAIGMMASIIFTENQPTSTGLWEHCVEILRPVLEPEQLKNFDSTHFVNAFKADKKHGRGQYHLIVPKSASSTGLGVEEIQLTADKASANSVLYAMQQALTMLKSELAEDHSAKVAGK